MKSPASLARPTFRDPAGSLRIVGGRVFRTVRPEFADDCLSFLSSETAREWVASGRLIETQILHHSAGKQLELEHPRVSFPSYPWEWTPGQWVSAAELTLELAEHQIDAGRILKDATPLNVLFEGNKAIFVDVLSTESRDLNDPLWLAYGQFVRTFLLPLAAYKYLGWSLASSFLRRDGYTPADLYPHLSARQRYLSPLFSLITIPHLLERKGNSRPVTRPKHHPDLAAALHLRRLKNLRQVLHRLAPKLKDSGWSRYSETANHYGEKDRAAKQEYVRSVLASVNAKCVLDVGANTGEYSRLAAEAGASVVGLDTDVAASEHSWRIAQEKGLPILPLVADIARPTPAIGWRNRESASLLERAREHFDCVMMLGIIHHLLLKDQIPLDEIAQLTAVLTIRCAIVEWVPSGDPRFIDLCCGREFLYRHLNEEVFLHSFSHFFTPVHRQALNNGRVLFLFPRYT